MLSDFDTNGCVDPSGIFRVFFQKTAAILTPKLSNIFRNIEQINS